MGAPQIPVLGASTVAHTSQGSPSIDILPPDEGVVLADVDSVGCMRSTSGSQACCRTMTEDDVSRMDVSSSSVSSAGIPFSATMLWIDGSCVLHPFSLHKFDAGYIRLMTIAHAFNYRNGVKSAIRVGRSRKAEGRFLMDTDLSWGQQVAIMFQIVSTLALEMPLFLEALAEIQGVSPNVQLDCEPWGHIDHSDGHFSSRSSNRTAAYIHDLAFIPRESVMSSSEGMRRLIPL